MPKREAAPMGTARDTAMRAAQVTIWSAVAALLRDDRTTAAALCVGSTDDVLCEAAVNLVANLLNVVESGYGASRADILQLADNAAAYQLGLLAGQAVREMAGV